VFEERFVPPFKISSQCLSLLPFYKNSPRYKQPRSMGELQVDKSRPWCFFNGACNDSICGCGFVFHLTDLTYFHFKANVGRGTNNFSEFMALFLLLKFSLASRV
jgi:hypothetical protein